MAVNYGQGYNVYDNIRRKVRQKKAAGYSYGEKKSVVDYGTKVDYGATPATPSASFRGTTTTGPAMKQATGRTPEIFGTLDGVPTALGIGEATTGLEFEEKLTPAEYGAQKTYGTYGIATEMAKKGELTGNIGTVLENIIGAIDPSPFGAFSGLMSGDLRRDPYGREVAVPSGMLGAVAEMNLEQQYEVATKIADGVAGYHQFYSNGRLVSIAPQQIMGYDVGYAVLGTFEGGIQDAINSYAALLGYDPRTVNLQVNPKADPTNFGSRLSGFVKGAGGIAEDGKFISATGQSINATRSQLETHLGLTSTLSGLDSAIDALQKTTLSLNEKQSLTEALTNGNLAAKEVRDNQGGLVGYSTATGSVVTTTDLTPVMGGGAPVHSGTGYMSAMQALGYDPRELGSSFRGPDPTDPYSFGSYTEPTPVTSSDTGSDSPTPSGGDNSYNFNVQDIETQDLGYSPSYGYAAKGGLITRKGMQEGGVPPEQVPAGEAPVAAEAGFVGTEPENVADGETVKDDVPVEVPEGTFVLNAAAVEFMGSADVKKMILEAMKEAEKQGIDIKQENAKIPKEDLVSLVVSKGEVIIPPQLAEIIGYDRLNKINNRGKAEVERRSQESEQMKEAAPKPPILAKSGGFISKPA